MLRSVAIVVSQQTAKSFTALDLAIMLANFLARLDDRVFQTLVIAFFVVVFDVRPNGISQRALAEENHASQALRFQRSEKSFDVSVQVWTLRRQYDRLHTRLCEHLAKRWAESTITIHEEILLVVEKTIFKIGQFTSLLLHPWFFGVRRVMDELDATRLQVDDEQQVECNQASGRPDFHGREVDRCQDVPVGFEEGGSRRLSLAIASRLNPMTFENVADRLI
jgi:hypothetical protein